MGLSYMILYLSLLFGLFVLDVESVLQNASCPSIFGKPFRWEKINGKWYINSVTTDLDVAGDCATFTFNHTVDRTDVWIKWTEHKVASSYNGTVINMDLHFPDAERQLDIKYTDGERGTYRFLELEYEDYAIMFSCSNIGVTGNLSDFELWELSRKPNGVSHTPKLMKILAKYRIPYTHFLMFDNSHKTCNSGFGITVTCSALAMIILLSIKHLLV